MPRIKLQSKKFFMMHYLYCGENLVEMEVVVVADQSAEVPGVENILIISQ